MRAYTISKTSDSKNKAKSIHTNSLVHNQRDFLSRGKQKDCLRLSRTKWVYLMNMY